MTTYMQCGHAANAVLRLPSGDVPCCVICDGPAARTPGDAPSLEGRMAICSYGTYDGAKAGQHTRSKYKSYEVNEPVPSAWNLAFFEYRGPGSPWATEKCAHGYFRSMVKAHESCPPRGPHEYDVYYDGCWGWD